MGLQKYVTVSKVAELSEGIITKFYCASMSKIYPQHNLCHLMCCLKKMEKKIYQVKKQTLHIIFLDLQKYVKFHIFVIHCEPKHFNMAASHTHDDPSLFCDVDVDVDVSASESERSLSEEFSYFSSKRFLISSSLLRIF